MPHHSNGEVIVDDLKGHKISYILGVVWYHLHTPAVHVHQQAPFDLFQDLTEVRAVVSWPIEDKQNRDDKTNY